MNQEAFPKDLASSGQTLLIIKWQKNWGRGYDEKSLRILNEKLEKLVSELAVPAVAVTPEELDTEKYSDLTKYRYILRPYDQFTKHTETVRTKVQHAPTDVYLTNNSSTMTMELYFTDRKENKAYASTNYPVNDYRFGIKCAIGHYQ